MKASYYVSIHTGTNYSPDEYTQKAGTLLNIACDILCSEEHMKGIARGGVESVHTEMEVLMQRYDAGVQWDATEGCSELVLKAVIDLVGTGRLTVDKGKLSGLLRGHSLNEWGANLKIEKKAVPKEMLD